MTRRGALHESSRSAPDALVGSRFDVAVSKMLGISRAKAADLIESGQARVLDRAIAKSGTLLYGETVEFDIVEERHEPEPVCLDMAIAYEDDDVVVVDKPVGVAAHASAGWTGPTVLGSLLKRGVRITSYGAPGRQGIVSRLDVGTSGLMLVCKSELAYKEMRRQFSEHEVVKTYHAMVQGNLKEDKATIEAPIGRAKVSDFRFCVTPSGKPAVTHWDVLDRFGEATLVSVNLETGRTHQIRVHFSSIGHPLVGDPMYGANPVLAGELGLDRQWLHAMKLEFRHPRTHLWTSVESHYPADLAHALELMRAGMPQLVWKRRLAYPIGLSRSAVILLSPPLAGGGCRVATGGGPTPIRAPPLFLLIAFLPCDDGSDHAGRQQRYAGQRRDAFNQQ